MKRKIFFLAFIVWVILWISFTARELFLKGQLTDYKTLLSLSLEGKHAHVTGLELYEIITRANRQLAPGGSYKLSGVKDNSLDKRRAVYYLYPHIEKEKPDLVLFYDSKEKV